MLGLRPTELLILIAVFALVFGSSQIPKMARALGQARRELDRAARGSDDSNTSS